MLKSAWGGALFPGILRILRILGIYRGAAFFLHKNRYGLRAVCVPHSQPPQMAMGAMWFVQTVTEKLQSEFFIEIDDYALSLIV